MKQIIYSCAIAMLALLGSRGAMAQGVSHNTTGAPAHASAMLDVASTNKGVLVPRMTAAQKAAIVSPATGLMVFQTDGTAGFYYYTGSAWSAVGGSSLPSGTNGQVLQLVSGSPAWVGNTLSIGASFGGGKVAYVLQAGDPGYDPLVQHGLIAATSDQSTGIVWDGNLNGFSGATGYLLGTGRNNTEIAYQIIGSGTAAFVCRSYAGGGFTDWYLPSRDELNKLYINKIAIGGFASASYWSSSEYLGNVAWYQYFGSTGSQSYSAKINSYCVRAVRAF